MLEVQDPDHFAEVMKFAAQQGLVDQLIEQFQARSEYANGPGCTFDKNEGKNTKVVIGKDSAPYSFGFSHFRQYEPDGEWEYWFSGGLIYQGPSSPANGSAPSFTVGP